MNMRPKNRGFSRTVFEILERCGPLSANEIKAESNVMGKHPTDKQLKTCLRNMRARQWIEQTNVKQFDLRSKVLKGIRDMDFQQSPEPIEINIVETKAPLPLHIIGMLLCTAVVTAVSTALAIRIF